MKKSGPSRAGAAILPNEHSTLTSTFCQERNPQKREKWKQIYEDWRSVTGFGTPKRLKLEQHDAQESAEKRPARLEKWQLTSSLARGFIAALHHSNS
jgi:hypothetical protein